MTMGSAGMAEMGSMEMPLPDNTLPMMSGTGPYGPIEMGGMFTTVKIRHGLARDDYQDPGPYPQPAGTRAYEWKGADLEPKRAPQAAHSPAVKPIEVRKPSGHSGH
jgi:hypothetical protein